MKRNNSALGDGPTLIGPVDGQPNCMGTKHVINRRCCQIVKPANQPITYMIDWQIPITYIANDSGWAAPLTSTELSNPETIFSLKFYDAV